MPDIRWVLISEYSPMFWNWPDETYLRICELQGQKAWTEGHIVCLGEPPLQNEPVDKRISLERIEPHFSREVYELHPLAVADLGGYATVIFDSGHLIQAKFFNLFREKWPSSKFFGCEQSKHKVIIGGTVLPILIRDGEKLVGAVMAVSPKGREETIVEVLKTALNLKKVKEAQAWNEANAT